MNMFLSQKGGVLIGVNNIIIEIGKMKTITTIPERTVVRCDVCMNTDYQVPGHPSNLSFLSTGTQILYVCLMSRHSSTDRKIKRFHRRRTSVEKLADWCHTLVQRNSEDDFLMNH